MLWRSGLYPLLGLLWLIAMTAAGLRRVPELPRFAWYVSNRAESHRLMGAGMPPDHVGL